MTSVAIAWEAFVQLVRRLKLATFKEKILSEANN